MTEKHIPQVESPLLLEATKLKVAFQTMLQNVNKMLPSLPMAMTKITSNLLERILKMSLSKRQEVETKTAIFKHFPLVQVLHQSKLLTNVQVAKNPVMLELFRQVPVEI